MNPSTIKFDEWCELSRYQDHDCRLSLYLKDSIDGYNNNDMFSTQTAGKERQKILEESRHIKNYRMLTDEQEEYLTDFLHPELIYEKPKKQYW